MPSISARSSWCVSCIVLAIGACTGVPKVDDVESGVVVDAGSDDGGVSMVDEDAGVATEEPRACDWSVPPISECEEDADFCDPIGETAAPRDIVAGWSRIEGDRVIVQLQFASWPFHPLGEGEAYLDFAETKGSNLYWGFGYGDALSFRDDVHGKVSVERALGLTSLDVKCGIDCDAEPACFDIWSPPALMWFYEGPGRYSFVEPRPLLRMSPERPLIEFSFTLAQTLSSTGVLEWMAATIGDPVNQTHDWPDDTSIQDATHPLAVSRGGESDFTPTLVDAREWVCPGLKADKAVALEPCASGAPGVCAEDGSAWSCVDGLPRFVAWCQHFNHSACELRDGQGARCVLPVFDVDTCSGGLLSHCDADGVVCKSDVWTGNAGCEVRSPNGYNPSAHCREGAPSCEGRFAFPVCVGDALLRSCDFGSPTYIDCGPGTCDEGACRWPVGSICDDEAFRCEEGATCVKAVGMPWGYCEAVD